MLISGIMPPSGIKLSCMALTAPHEAAVVITAKSAEGDAEAHLLALHVARRGVDAERRESRIGLRFRPVADGHADNEQDAHGGENGPALPFIADHAPEDVGQRRADDEDQQHLRQVAEGGRVLVRVCRVGVEEAAAVRPQHLDGELGSRRPLRDRLLRAFERCRLHIGADVLRNPLPDEEQRGDERDRQQQVEHAAGKISPEVADRARLALREAANEGERQRHPGRRRDEVLHGETSHLHEVTHRALAAVVLPVGVGGKARGGIEGEVRGATAGMPSALSGSTACSRCSA